MSNTAITHFNEARPTRRNKMDKNPNSFPNPTGTPEQVKTKGRTSISAILGDVMSK